MALPGLSSYIFFTLCSFVVNSTRRFISSRALQFVLVLLSPFSIAITPTSGRGLVCVLFARLFVLRVLVCVSFLFLLVSGIGWLRFVIVAYP